MESNFFEEPHVRQHDIDGFKSTPEALAACPRKLVRNTWLHVISSRYTVILRIESKYWECQKVSMSSDAEHTDRLRPPRLQLLN